MLKNNVKASSGESWLQKGKTKKNIFVLCVIGPVFASFLLFTLYPNIMSVYYSFFQWNGTSKPLYVGLDNFRMVLTDRYMWTALFHNFILILVVPICILMVSVFIADALVTRNFKEGKFYKVLYFFPNILSSVVIGLIWAFIYNGSFGLLNSALRLVGVNIGDFYWLGDKRFALIAVMLPLIWASVGFYLIIFMNAMSTIPKSLYESAILDGITKTQRLFKITLPLISGVMRVGIILMILNVFKGFDLIMVLTRGGPGGATDVIGLYMFNYAFASSTAGGAAGNINYGYASTIGLVLFVILVAFKIAVDKLDSKEVIEY